MSDETELIKDLEEKTELIFSKDEVKEVLRGLDKSTELSLAEIRASSVLSQLPIFSGLIVSFKELKRDKARKRSSEYISILKSALAQNSEMIQENKQKGFFRRFMDRF